MKQFYLSFRLAARNTWVAGGFKQQEVRLEAFNVSQLNMCLLSISTSSARHYSTQLYSLLVPGTLFSNADSAPSEVVIATLSI